MKTFQAAVIAIVCTSVIGSAVFAQQPTNGTVVVPKRGTVVQPKRGTVVTPQRGVVPTQTGVVHRDAPAGSRYTVTPQQKAASDQFMRTGLSQMQAASSAMQSGNTGQAKASMLAGLHSMQQAYGIYTGHRDYAIISATDAIQELQERPLNSHKINVHIDHAINEAQTALKVN